MNKKRWFALLGAAVLFVVSIISQFGANVAATDWDELLNLNEFKEKEIEAGFGGEKIVVASLEGVIQDVEANQFINAGMNNYKRFLKVLDNAAEDDSVDGIIINVNSPGGGVVESAEIHDKVIEIQEEYNKPVYVSMGNMAASGGYYISAPAEKIVAHPATLTGSIGVIMESINFSDLADEYGIDFNTIKSGKHKDIMSASRKMTDEERDILQSMIDEMYDEFVQIIVDGRGMSESEVRRLGDGRVYTGKQAQENGLVDELGSLDDTIAMMEEDYGWKDSRVVEYEVGFNFGSVLGVSVKNLLGKEADLFNFQNMLRESNAPRAMYLYSK
ncbi:MAG TPA: signal peptide peptidase SppA [Candidatus Avamphibacillus sp.]|nr:signal peptide peptidase SppA [Candidatus Avamphibacillus sp.]